MKKIQMNLIRLYAILFILLGIELVLNLSHSSLDKFFYPIILFLIFMIPFELMDRFRKSGVYFGEEGVNWRIGDKNNIKKWSELVIEKKIDLKYLKYLNLNLNHEGKSLTLLIFWPTEQDIIFLTQKYAPKDHALYAIVKDYAEKRGLMI